MGKIDISIEYYQEISTLLLRISNIMLILKDQRNFNVKVFVSDNILGNNGSTCTRYIYNSR